MAKNIGCFQSVLQRSVSLELFVKVNSVVVYIYMLGGIDLNEKKTSKVINWVRKMEMGSKSTAVGLG